MAHKLKRTINAKELRAHLPEVVLRVRRGERFTVLYRSAPAFEVVPIEDRVSELPPLSEDSLYRASAVGESSDGLGSEDHDALLYGSRR
jgi:prevent-host-death family protein